MFQSQVPTRFWGDCILTATYLVNRLRNSASGFKTPYELLFSTKPTHHHLKNFGCLCFLSTLKHGRAKFEPKAQPCVLLGYHANKKAYKVYNLVTKQIHHFRDFVFHKHYFPFHRIHTSDSVLPNNIFLSSNYADDNPIVFPDALMSEDQPIPDTTQTSHLLLDFNLPHQHPYLPQCQFFQPHLSISSVS